MSYDQITKHCLGVSSHRALISSKQHAVTDFMVEKSGQSPGQVTKSNNSTGELWRPSVPWRWCIIPEVPARARSSRLVRRKDWADPAEGKCRMKGRVHRIFQDTRGKERL